MDAPMEVSELEEARARLAIAERCLGRMVVEQQAANDVIAVIAGLRDALGKEIARAAGLERVIQTMQASNGDTPLEPESV